MPARKLTATEKMERIQDEIRRMEDRAKKKNRRLLPGERVDVQRQIRLETKWKIVRSSAPKLLCPDCGRGPLLGRQAWCVLRGLRDRGGPPRVTCKSCVKTKWERQGTRLVRKSYKGPRREGPTMIAVLRYQFTIGALSRLRDEVGVSQMDLAREAGCSRALIRRCEDHPEHTELKIEQVVQFKEAFEKRGAGVTELAELIAVHYGDVPDDPDATEVNGEE